jgi:hypothetical protein
MRIAVAEGISHLRVVIFRKFHSSSHIQALLHSERPKQGTAPLQREYSPGQATSKLTRRMPGTATALKSGWETADRSSEADERNGSLVV